MEKYLEMLRELRDYGNELLENGTESQEIETMNFHLGVAILNVCEELGIEPNEEDRDFY